jgi:alanyl-tRNA synthetase
MSISALVVDTRVTYPDGDVTSSGSVLHVEPLADGRAAIILDRTAFHPIDPVWPDQPADQGIVRVGGVAHPVLDAVVGATDGTTLFVGDAPVRTGTEGWVFVVCHVVADPDGSVASTLAPGAEAAVEVDARVRRALSTGHTACHLASLALNAALAGLWSKDVPTDGRGEPNFDQLAIAESRILPNGSLDTYRIGKSLRKKGFSAAELPASLGATEETANRLLAEWITSGAAVAVVRGGSSGIDSDGLGERRIWRCELAGGAVEIPCGGTHIASLHEFASVSIALELADTEGALELRMRTSAVRV